MTENQLTVPARRGPMTAPGPAPGFRNRSVVVASIRRTSGVPVGVGNAHAPARLRRAAAMHASVCEYGKPVAVQGTWFATVAIDGRLKGLEGAGSG